MAISLTPYLNFDNRTRTVMEDYQSIFGGSLDITLFKDMGGAPTPALAEGVMHAQLTVNEQTGLMASDAFDVTDLTNGLAISLSLTGAAEDAAELHAIWDKLSVGANVLQPLMAAPWGATFGMLIDKNNVRWLFNIAN